MTSQMSRTKSILWIAFVAVLGMTSLPSGSFADVVIHGECPVTPYTAEGLDDAFTTTWFGGYDFGAGPDRSYRGTWYAGSEGMKVQWRVPPGAAVSAEGRRLDATAPPLEVTLARGYEGYPYQVSRLRVPSEECWEVTGQIAEHALRFVVWVHPERDDPYITNPPTPVANIWETLHCPLAPSVVQSGSVCPISQVRQVTRAEGPALGAGPIYVQGLGDDETVRLGGRQMQGNAFSIPVRWIAEPEANGPFLIRGLSMGTPDALLFGDTDPQAEIPVSDITSQGSPDWQVWHLSGVDTIRLPGTGCYALQIDGTKFTETIIFTATKEVLSENQAPEP